jgi:hypothetical protein
VRWDELFDDLEAQLVEAELADLQAEVSDRERREVALLHLVARLRPVIGEPVTVRVLGAGVIEGRLSAFGPDWLLLAEVSGREALVAATAVLAVGGLAAQTSAPHSEGAVAARLNLAFALRAVVRDRAAVTVTLIDGTAEGGTLDRVGADFLELAAHPPDEVRRRDAVRSIRTYPLTAIALIRRA